MSSRYLRSIPARRHAFPSTVTVYPMEKKRSRRVGERDGGRPARSLTRESGMRAALPLCGASKSLSALSMYSPSLSEVEYRPFLAITFLTWNRIIKVVRIEGKERVYLTYASTPFLIHVLDAMLELAKQGDFSRLAQFIDIISLATPEEFRIIYTKEKEKLEAQIPAQLQEWLEKEGREMARNEAELAELTRQQHDYLLAAARLQAFSKAGEETGLTWYKKKLIHFM